MRRSILSILLVLLRLIILGLFVIFITSCDPIFTYYFENKSNKDIWVINDFNSTDGQITSGSEVRHIGPNETITYSDMDWWYFIVKDSMHFYILDHSSVELRHERRITQDEVDTIPPEAIISRITVLKEELHQKNYCFKYP